MLRDVIHELFFMIVGTYMVFAPLSGNTEVNWSVFLIGVLLLSVLLVTYTVGFRFDKKFKEVFLSDKDLDSKLPLALTSPKFALSLRFVRATMYARNIVLPKGTKKNWIQESWFHEYNFRKHARKIDIFSSYLFFFVIAALVVYGIASSICDIHRGRFL